MSRLIVNTQSGSYPIIIKEDIIRDAGKELITILQPKKLFIVTDENVAALYLETLQQSLTDEGFEFAAYVLPAGEASKSMGNLECILSGMAQTGVTRSDAAVALGGGVVGDITGFAAAVYMRGIPYIQIPTTLLSQIDSSVGGKTAVNLKEGKNLAGAFYQPKAVLSDPLALNTLDKTQMGEGMAEMIKYACIADAHMFEELLQGCADLARCIENCCAIKKRTVEEDELDTGIRMILNFGHTIGHAIEACAGYRYSHGQAVAAGMAHITQKSEAMGLTQAGTAARIREILQKYSLPSEIPAELKEGVLDAMARDKKLLSGKMNLVLLKNIGECFIHPVTLPELKAFI